MIHKSKKYACQLITSDNNCIYLFFLESLYDLNCVIYIQIFMKLKALPFYFLKGIECPSNTVFKGKVNRIFNVIHHSQYVCHFIGKFSGVQYFEKQHLNLILDSMNFSKWLNR